MKFKSRNKNKGFTLIELLLVIAILGLLAAVTLAVTTRARAQARDAKRIADMKAIYTAMQLYINSNGNPPNCWDPGYIGGCDVATGGSFADTSWDNIYVRFLSSYLGNTKDPLNDAGHVYGYSTSEFPIGSGIEYKFIFFAILETPHPELADIPHPDGGAASDYSYILGERK